MREILFRGKTKEGVWVLGHYVGNNTLIALYDVNYDVGCIDTSNSHECIPKTIGQYTGLKDKNGVKIFEGDILQDKYLDDEGIEQISYFEVIYKNGCFGIDTSYSRKRLDCEPILKYFQPEELEISGNIHDNKELIKEE